MRRRTLILELIVLFIAMPMVLLIPIHPGFKAGILLLAVAYALRVTFKEKLVLRKALLQLPKTKYWKNIWLRLALLIAITIPFIYFTQPDSLFIVARKNLWMLIGISVFYSLFSVYPQEFLYRTYFLNRYGHLFKNQNILIFVNAIIFSFAHIAFKNGLVLFMTFIGGIVFAMTFIKTKSLLLTSIEHALYGCWIFTVGMGEMLAFPMPE
jgi:uncharacterized protein